MPCTRRGAMSHVDGHPALFAGLPSPIARFTPVAPASSENRASMRA
jgi:hypothetical protein